MFIGTEIRLDIGLDTARDKLADLARGGLFGRVSGGAYDQWQAGLVRGGAHATMLGMYRIAQVRVADMATCGKSALWAMRWEVAGRGGTLVPALDADIKLIPAGPDVTVLAVSAVCRPPLAELTDGLDPAVTRRAAQEAIQVFANRIAACIASPPAVPDAGHGTMLPEPTLEAGYRARAAC